MSQYVGNRGGFPPDGTELIVFQRIGRPPVPSRFMRASRWSGIDEALGRVSNLSCEFRDPLWENLNGLPVDADVAERQLILASERLRELRSIASTYWYLDRAHDPSQICALDEERAQFVCMRHEH